MGGTARRRVAATIVLVLALVAFTTSGVRAQDPVTVQVNHGRLLRVDGIERVVVAAPEIADVNLINRNELMVIAKRVGETTISVWHARGMTTYRVVVEGAPAADPAVSLRELLREPNVQVKIIGEAVILEGSVKTAADRARAEGIASAYGKRIINLLTVEQPTPSAPAATQVLEAQLRDALKELPVAIRLIRDDTVLIEGSVATQSDLARVQTIARAYVRNVVTLVRIREPLQFSLNTWVAEINRTALKQLGVEWGGGAIIDQEIVMNPFIFHYGTQNQVFPGTPLQLLIARLRFLEQQGIARTLANPRLVVQEGKQAKLLVGGEIPIPIVGSDRTVTILFKEFGVRLEFKAMAEAGEPINLEMKTEVSALDFANAIIISGFTIPALKTRKAETILNIRPNDFLVIGGLIQRDESKTVQKVPILGDLPIIGALFRSERFQRGETELVIFVSPTLVSPTREKPKEPGENGTSQP
ncbi:MAG: pilus assembly protein N-terminal domain-containing protein [Armatimonadetes bacterium]|nr:pilus assembly protein N-terminal domain-containing protein [Armatimonadota bacterium]